MKKVLLVGPEASVAATLAAGLESEGALASTVGDGFSALSIAEREQPDAVVVWAPLADVPALELGVILRHDPAIADVGLILVTGELGDSAATVRETIFDRVFTEEVGESDLLRAIGEMIASEDQLTAPTHLRGSVSGSLDVLTLVDWVQVLGTLQRTGVLEIADGDGFEAQIVFDRGSIRHVDVGEACGFDAFAELLRGIERLPSAGFRFDQRAASDVEHFPSSVMKTANELLLGCMKILDDETRAALAEIA